MVVNPISEAVARFRALLASGQAETAAKMLDSYTGILNRIEPNLRVVLSEIATEGMTPARLFEQQRLETIMAQVAEEVGKYARQVEPQIAARQQTAIALAQKHARDLTHLSLGEPPADFTGPTWATIDPKTLENLVGLTADGAPFGDELRRLAGGAVERVKDALIRGAGTGQSAEQIAGGVKDALGGHVARFLTVARTAEMHAYTSAQMQCFEENADVVKGWRWHASLSFDTCLACLAMHGKRFPLGTPMERHFNCRCMAIPETRSHYALGFPDSKENKRKWQTGQEWLDAQSEENQQLALGKTRWESWKKGEVELGDFLGHSDYPKWGGMYHENSLQSAREKARKRGAASTLASPTPAPKPTPQITPAVPAASPAPTPTNAPPSPVLSLPTVEQVFDNKLKGALKTSCSVGMDAINEVHRVDGLPIIPLVASASRKFNGEYRFFLSGVPKEIAISSHGSHPDLTVCHEIGHFLDHMVLGNKGQFASASHPALDAWRKAVQNSKAVQNLKNLQGQKEVNLNIGGTPFKVQIKQSHLSYLLGNDEVLARSYAQYIATRSTSSDLKAQVAKIVGNQRDIYAARQWEDKDFEPIADAFDELFRQKGWLL